MGKSRTKARSGSNGATGKIVATVLAVAILAGGVCCTGYASRNDNGKWFSNSNIASWHWSDKSVNKPNDKDDLAYAVSANVTINQDKMNGIRLLSAPMALADLEAYNVSEQADSVQLLTASLEPLDATYQAVDFTAAWQNASSTWANGKNVMEYIQLSQASDGALTCAVSVLKSFSEPIVITCKARPLQSGAWSPSATCTVNYFKRITSFKSFSSYWETSYVDDEGESQTETSSGTNLVTNPLIYYSNDGEGADYCIFTTTCNYGEGTKTSNCSFTYKLEIAPELASSIGVSTSVATMTSPTWKNAIDTVLGASNVSNRNTRLSLYNKFKSAYDAGKPAFVLKVTGTYKDFDDVFTYSFNLKFNPLAFGIAANKVNLDKDNMDF